MASRYRVKFLDLKTASSQPSRAIPHAAWYASRFVDVEVDAETETQAIRRGWDALEARVRRYPHRSEFACLGAVALP